VQPYMATLPDLSTQWTVTEISSAVATTDMQMAARNFQARLNYDCEVEASYVPQKIMKSPGQRCYSWHRGCFQVLKDVDARAPMCVMHYRRSWSWSRWWSVAQRRRPPRVPAEGAKSCNSATLPQLEQRMIPRTCGGRSTRSISASQAKRLRMLRNGSASTWRRRSAGECFRITEMRSLFMVVKEGLNVLSCMSNGTTVSC
jgi:hypothetical protein